MRYDEARISVLLSDVTDGVELDPDVQRELDQDLRFQAELVQYRKLMRGLRSLRAEMLEPADDLIEDVLAALDDEAERHGLRAALTPRRAAYFGGIAAAATAAGVGTALVLARRRAA